MGVCNDTFTCMHEAKIHCTYSVRSRYLTPPKGTAAATTTL